MSRPRSISLNDRRSTSNSDLHPFLPSAEEEEEKLLREAFSMIFCCIGVSRIAGLRNNSSPGCSCPGPNCRLHCTAPERPPASSPLTSASILSTTPSAAGRSFFSLSSFFPGGSASALQSSSPSTSSPLSPIALQGSPAAKPTSPLLSSTGPARSGQDSRFGLAIPDVRGAIDNLIPRSSLKRGFNIIMTITARPSSTGARQQPQHSHLPSGYRPHLQVSSVPTHSPFLGADAWAERHNHRDSDSVLSVPKDHFPAPRSTSSSPSPSSSPSSHVYYDFHASCPACTHIPLGASPSAFHQMGPTFSSSSSSSASPSSPSFPSSSSSSVASDAGAEQLLEWWQIAWTPSSMLDSPQADSDSDSDVLLLYSRISGLCRALYSFLRQLPAHRIFSQWMKVGGLPPDLAGVPSPATSSSSSSSFPFSPSPSSSLSSSPPPSSAPAPIRTTPLAVASSSPMASPLPRKTSPSPPTGSTTGELPELNLGYAIKLLYQAETLRPEDQRWSEVLKTGDEPFTRQTFQALYTKAGELSLSVYYAAKIPTEQLGARRSSAHHSRSNSLPIIAPSIVPSTPAAAGPTRRIAASFDVPSDFLCLPGATPAPSVGKVKDRHVGLTRAASPISALVDSFEDIGVFQFETDSADLNERKGTPPPSLATNSRFPPQSPGAKTMAKLTHFIRQCDESKLFFASEPLPSVDEMLRLLELYQIDS